CTPSTWDELNVRDKNLPCDGFTLSKRGQDSQQTSAEPTAWAGCAGDSYEGNAAIRGSPFLFGTGSASHRKQSSPGEATERSGMGFAREGSAAVILVALTLWLQCAGMAILIHLARTSIARGIKGLGPWHSAVLMSRFTAVMIILHILQILLWAGFYRWRCFPSWESCFYFSATSYSTVGYGDIVLPRV